MLSGSAVHEDLEREFTNQESVCIMGAGVAGLSRILFAVSLDLPRHHSVPLQLVVQTDNHLSVASASFSSGRSSGQNTSISISLNLSATYFS